MPKLLYLITEDWFFVSHFMPMARTARAAGFEVVVQPSTYTIAAFTEAIVDHLRKPQMDTDGHR